MTMHAAALVAHRDIGQLVGGLEAVAAPDMGMAVGVEVHARVRGALDADLGDAGDLEFGFEALADPAGDVLVGRLRDVRVQQPMVQRGDAALEAVAQRADFSAGKRGPAGGKFGADGGQVAVAVQATRAVAGGQRVDLAGGLEAGRSGEKGSRKSRHPDSVTRPVFLSPCVEYLFGRIGRCWRVSVDNHRFPWPDKDLRPAQRCGPDPGQRRDGETTTSGAATPLWTSAELFKRHPQACAQARSQDRIVRQDEKKPRDGGALATMSGSTAQGLSGQIDRSSCARRAPPLMTFSRVCSRLRAS